MWLPPLGPDPLAAPVTADNRHSVKDALRLRDHYGIRTRWLATFVISGLVVIVTLCVVIGTLVGVHYGRHNCSRYQAFTGRAAKFVRYSYWSWDCLTPNPSQPGTWIPINQLRGVAP